MSINNPINRIIQSPARKESLAYLRSIPLKRLVLLAAAAFMVFAAIGFLSSIIANQPRTFGAGYVSAAYWGVFGAAYSMVAARRPVAVFAVIAVQFITTPLLRLPERWISRGLPLISFETAARSYVPWAIVLITLSYATFLRFIRSEGRYAFRAQNELALAHSIQETLVPVLDLVVGGCEVYGISNPSERVGGDLVDAVALSDGSGFAYLTDIAGHGLQAGILMGRVKTAFRACLVDAPAPGRLLDKLNAVLPSVKEAHMYATCAALHLQPRPGGGCDMEFALAGHPPLLHLSAAGILRGELADKQFPLGLIPFSGYPCHRFEAARGDLIIAATDGVLEVCGKDGLELGVEGIAATVQEHAMLSLAGMAKAILAAAKLKGPQDDDQTLLLIRVL